MALSVGLDGVPQTTATCVVSEHGGIVREAQLASEPQAPVRWPGVRDGGIAMIGPDVGPLAPWLHRAEPRARRAIVQTATRPATGPRGALMVRSDLRYGDGRARRLHLGWLRPVHWKPVSAPDMRAGSGACHGHPRAADRRSGRFRIPGGTGPLDRCRPPPSTAATLARHPAWDVARGHRLPDRTADQRPWGVGP